MVDREREREKEREREREKERERESYCIGSLKSGALQIDFSGAFGCLPQELLLTVKINVYGLGTFTQQLFLDLKITQFI